VNFVYYIKRSTKTHINNKQSPRLNDVFIPLIEQENRRFLMWKNYYVKNT